MSNIILNCCNSNIKCKNAKYIILGEIKLKFFVLSKKYFIFLIILLLILIILSLLFTKTNKSLVENQDKGLNIVQSTYQDTYNKEFLQKKFEERKLLALTFDDGPSKYTEKFVEELHKRNIIVTFFILGENAKKYPNTVKLAYDFGNEIGIHSYEHKLFTKLTEEEIILEIDRTKQTIKNYVDSPITLIRVPYGSRNKKVDMVLEKLNLTDILWDVDSKDWKLKNTTKVYNYTLKCIKGNNIILMHDTFKTSIEAAIKLVDSLSSNGYIFVNVSTLLEFKE